MSMRPQSHKKKWRYIGEGIVTSLGLAFAVGCEWPPWSFSRHPPTPDRLPWPLPSRCYDWLLVFTHTADVFSVGLSRVLGMKCTIPLGCTSRPDARIPPPIPIYLITWQDPFLRSHDDTWASSVGYSRPENMVKMSWNGWVSGPCVYNIYHRFLWLVFAAC